MLRSGFYQDISMVRTWRHLERKPICIKRKCESEYDTYVVVCLSVYDMICRQ